MINFNQHLQLNRIRPYSKNNNSNAAPDFLKVEELLRCFLTRFDSRIVNFIKRIDETIFLIKIERHSKLDKSIYVKLPGSVNGKYFHYP